MATRPQRSNPNSVFWKKSQYTPRSDIINSTFLTLPLPELKGGFNFLAHAVFLTKVLENFVQNIKKNYRKFIMILKNS